MKRFLYPVLFFVVISVFLAGFFICSAEEDTGLHIVFEECDTESVVDIDDLGSTAVFTVVAENNDSSLYPISFSWNSDRGTVETIGNTSTFTIENIQLEDIGNYYCYVDDGVISTGVGCVINIETHLQWKTECPIDVFLEIGESISVSVKATSGYGDVSYEWYKWDHEGIVATGDTIEIAINSSEDYGHYQAQATDGLNYTSSVVLVCPKTDLVLNVDDISVVNGEDLLIKGVASISVTEDPEKQIAEEYAEDLMLMWAQYTFYEEENDYGIDDWFLFNGETEELYCTDYSGVLDGHSDATVKYRLENGILYADYSIAISNISDVWNGRYAIRAANRFEGSASQLFSISVKDYIDIKLVGDSGIGLSGVLHPDAKLFIEPIEDETIEEFFELAIEEDEYILISKEIYLVITGDAEEFKGELELSFPVGKDFEGKTMKILHKMGDDLEILYGTVTDGILTFKVDSLSPFAITAEKQEDNDQIENDDMDNSEDTDEGDISEDVDEDVPTDNAQDTQDDTTKDNKEHSSTESNEEKKNSSVPQTGDTEYYINYILLFVACSAVLLTLIYINKRTEKRG